MEEHSNNGNDILMSSASTTIDASVVQSRILQSSSLVKQQEHDEHEDVQQPSFPKLSAMEAHGGKVEYRRVRCPPHRYTPLRESWEQILTPLVQYLKLQVSIHRMLNVSLFILNWSAVHRMKVTTENSAGSCSGTAFDADKPSGSLPVCLD